MSLLEPPDVSGYWRYNWQLLRRICSGELAVEGRLGVVEKVILGVPQLVRVFSPRAAFGDEGTDLYVVLCFLATCVLLGTSTWAVSHGLALLWCAVVAWRIVDILSHHFGVLFIDRRVAADWKPRSRERTVAFAFVSFVELMVAFAVIYLWTGAVASSAGQVLSNPLDALYFSAVTMTTLGFGDFTPVRTSARVVVITQLLTALGFVSIVLQGVVNIALEKERRGDGGRAG